MVLQCLICAYEQGCIVSSYNNGNATFPTRMGGHPLQNGGDTPSEGMHILIRETDSYKLINLNRCTGQLSFNSSNLRLVYSTFVYFYVGIPGLTQNRTKNRIN